MEETSPDRKEERPEEEILEVEEFDELLRYTLPGYLLSLVVGWFFDVQGWERSAVGQWIVRTLAGEGESIFEGFFALKKRLNNMLFPWLRPMAGARGLEW